MALSFVVGYQTKTTETGFNTLTATFASVGTDKLVNIQDIKLGEGAVGYTDNLQILDADGNASTTYFWVNEGELDGVNPAGWTEDMGTMSEGSMPAGTSFIIDSSACAPVMFAGEVLKGALEFTTGKGFNTIGNASPVDVDIQTIKLGEGAVGYTDNIQLLDADGNAATTYFWVNEGELDGVNPAGWTEDMGTMAEASIPAGVGFLLDASEAGVKVTIPMAL